MLHTSAGKGPRNSTGSAGTTRKEVSRTINVEVPEEVYWHVRRCATQSRLSMKEFMARFCREAQVYPPRKEARTSGTR